MFSVTGKIIKVFKAPEGKTKEGKDYGGDNRLQLLGELSLRNGETRSELLTLSIPQNWHMEDIARAIDVQITLPVALMAQGGIIKAFIPETATFPQCQVHEKDKYSKTLKNSTQLTS